MANDVTLRLENAYIGSAYSPIVEVTDVTEGHEVSITSADPESAGHVVTHSFVVKDGGNAEDYQELSRMVREATEELDDALEALPATVKGDVDQWLDDHPEATTTVMDGAVTTAKLADASVTVPKLADDVNREIRIARENTLGLTDVLYHEETYLGTPLYNTSVNVETGNTFAREDRVCLGRLSANAIEVGDYPVNVCAYSSFTASLTNSYLGMITTDSFVTNTVVFVPRDVKSVMIVIDTTGLEDQDVAIASVKRYMCSDVDAMERLVNNTAGESRTVVTSINDIIPAYESIERTNYGVTYESLAWRMGRYWTNGYTSSSQYITTTWNLATLLKERPRAVRVQILDTSDLVDPRIIIGSTERGWDIADVYTDDLTVEVPPTHTSLRISVGAFPATDEQTATEELFTYYTHGWVEGNVRVTFLFDAGITPIGRYNDLATATYNGDSITYKFDSELQSALLLPSGYSNAGAPTPLILFAHGHKQDITRTAWSNDNAVLMLKRFAEAGYAVLDVNEMAHDSYDWCNPALIQRYLDALAYVNAHYNVRLDYMYADSMGGLNALVMGQMLRPKACVISGLRLDFEARWPNFTASEQAEILANFGLESWDSDVMKQWFLTIPEYEDKDGAAANPNHFPPTLYLWGNEDTYTSESLAKVAAMGRGGSIVETLGYAANHHKMCYLMDTAVPLEEGQPTCMQAALGWFARWKW